MGKKKALTKNKLCKLQRNTIDITENKVYNDCNNITKNIKKNIAMLACITMSGTLLLTGCGKSSETAADIDNTNNSS